MVRIKKGKSQQWFTGTTGNSSLYESNQQNDPTCHEGLSFVWLVLACFSSLMHHGNHVGRTFLKQMIFYHPITTRCPFSTKIMNVNKDQVRTVFSCTIGQLWDTNVPETSCKMLKSHSHQNNLE